MITRPRAAARDRRRRSGAARRGRPSWPDGGRGGDLGLAERLRADLGVDAVAQVERERHLERDDRQQQDVGERQQQAGAEAYVRLLGRAEAEADAAHGLEVVRVLGRLAELAAQPADVDVERLGGAEPVLVPHAVHQLLAGDDAAGVADELGEQVELLARERELLAVERGAAGGEVDVEVADRDRRLGRLVGARRAGRGAGRRACGRSPRRR